MVRKLFALALALSAFTAFARTRSVSVPVNVDAKVAGSSTASGIVSSVDGNLIRIADGLIAINAAGAKIVVGRGHEATVADIKPGMLVFAVVQDPTPVADGPLRATLITATPAFDTTLSGAVENVDTTNRTLTLLRQTIHVDDNTSFGGFRPGEGTGLGTIQRNQLVQVQADVVNSRLVAREVLVLAPVPPQVGRFRGTVKTIGTDAWTIEKENREPISVVVNSRTKITGSPKVGDTVEVLYQLDSSNAYIALAIVKFEIPVPTKIVHLHGFVKSIEGGVWTLRTDGGEKKFTVTDRTKVTPGIVVNDLVDVIALEKDGGALEAITVVKLRF